MKCLVAGALSAALAGCAGVPYSPPPIPEPALPMLAVRPVSAPSLTADYTHRMPVEPEDSGTAAPITPGFARPRIGS